LTYRFEYTLLLSEREGLRRKIDDEIELAKQKTTELESLLDSAIREKQEATQEIELMKTALENERAEFSAVMK
jgi:hypothetical protein